MGSAKSGLDKLTGGGKKANKANKGNLADIKALFESLNAFTGEQYGNALKGIDQIGVQGKQNALGQERIGLAGAQQNLAKSGLWGSTVMNAANRGIQSDTMRALSNIDSQIAAMKSGLYTSFAGQQSANIGNLASILGGVQYKPGTNWLGLGLQAGATAMSGGAA